MAKAQVAGALLEPKAVSVRDYLTHRTATPHLFDLAGHMDPDAFTTDGGVAGGAIGSPLYELVRTKGDRQTDVRLLVDDGERYLALAHELAKNLRCDVYLTPDHTEVRFLREPSTVTGDFWDVVAIDRNTGEPADWLLVRPPDLPTSVPTWFVSTRGRLRQSNGLVTVTLPGGIAFATKTTFRDTAYLAARMKPGTSPITTVAVNADKGRFAISRFDDAGGLLGGVEFATLIGASLDVIAPDVQLAFTWPAEDEACVALDAELARLADSLRRTVWVPQPQGAAFVMPGCGEFAAVDEVGGASAWRPYPPRATADWRPRYGTDTDGRLVPLGEVASTAFDGIPFVSVPIGQLEHLRPWYASVPIAEGLFAIDLAVLPDGRLGMLVHSGYVLAVGPRELRLRLREAGWQGQDMLLLCHPPAELWQATVDHVQSLVDVLGVDVWMPARGAQVWPQPDGRIAADGPEGAWHVVGYGRGERPVDDGRLPKALTRAARPDKKYEDVLPIAALGSIAADLTVVSDATLAVPILGIPSSYRTQVSEPQVSAPDDAPQSAVEPDAVVPALVLGSGGPHGVPWLPTAPVVNNRAIDLYLWTPQTNADVESWGLSSADLFLLAGRDPLRMADRVRNGYLLRVQAPEHTAVELLEHADDAPGSVQQQLLAGGATHLLPVAWFCDLRVTARYDLDGAGGVAARHDIDAAALAIRFDGADHGVPGLPNDVVHWPDKGHRADAPSYLMLPENTALDRQIVHRGFVPLSRRKPNLEDGHLLMEVKVRKRRAIDVPATLSTLAGFPVIGRMHDFVGLDLLLAEQDLGQAVLTRYWRQGPTGRPVATKLSGETLQDALAGDSVGALAA